MVLNVKNFNNIWGSLKDPTFRGGDLEKPISRGRLPKKVEGRLGQFVGFRGACQERGGSIFEGGGEG